MSKNRFYQEGQSLSEYALILALVGIAAIIVLSAFGDTIRVQFTCIVIAMRSEGGNETVPAISQFVLYDVASDTNVMSLNCRSRLKSSELSNSLTIRANVSSSSVNSVYFDLVGPVNKQQLENNPPYYLFGNSGASITGQNLPAGEYTLSATAYTGNNSGRASLPYVITFRIVDE